MQKADNAEILEYLQKLVNEYENRLDILRRQNQELTAMLKRERAMAVKDEYSMGYLDSEVKGLLEGKADAVKMANTIVLSIAERYATIMDAAKHLRASKIPWGAIGAAIIIAAILAPVAYFLSIPENFRAILMWFSLWTNQVFVAAVVLISAVAVAVVLRRRRGGG